MDDSLDIVKARRILNDLSEPELDALLRGDLQLLDVEERPKQRPGATRRPTKSDAVADAIQALDEPERRQELLAAVHCFFLRARAHKMMPWSLVTVDTDGSVKDDVLYDSGVFLDKVEGFLKDIGAYEVSLHWALQDGAVYACFLLRDLLDIPRLHVHHAAYLVYCPGLPVLAACAGKPAILVDLLGAVDRVLCVYDNNRVAVPRTTLTCAFQHVLCKFVIRKFDGGPDTPSFLRESAFGADGILKDGAAEPGVIDVDVEAAADRELEAAAIFDGSTKHPLQRYEITEEEEGGGRTELRITGKSVLESLRKLYILGELSHAGALLEPALNGVQSVTLRKHED